MANRFQDALDDMDKEMSFEKYMEKHLATLKLALVISAEQKKIKDLK